MTPDRLSDLKLIHWRLASLLDLPYYVSKFQQVVRSCLRHVLAVPIIVALANLWRPIQHS